MNMTEFMRRFVDLSERITEVELRCQTLGEERDKAIARMDVLEESLADLRKAKETLRMKNAETVRAPLQA